MLFPGLADSKNVQCRKYSGGMKRRLSAAMAVIGDPNILLLDEPVSIYSFRNLSIQNC